MSKNKSSPNWLKFGPEVHCYVFISNLMVFFQNFVIHIFWGQLWSQNLKFFKLTEISYRDTLLYAYTILMFTVFFRNFCHSFFLDKFSSKIWSFPNWLKFDTGVHCNMLITILMFIFSKFCHIILGKFGLKI